MQEILFWTEPKGAALKVFARGHFVCDQKAATPWRNYKSCEMSRFEFEENV